MIAGSPTVIMQTEPTGSLDGDTWWLNCCVIFQIN